MKTGFILLCIVGFGICLCVDTSDYEIASGGFAIALVFGIVLIFHTILCLSKGYHFRVEKAKYDAFVQTLTNARDKGNKYELSAIAKRISKWNEKIAEAKVDNKSWFHSQYLDDRVDDVEPIK